MSDLINLALDRSAQKTQARLQKIEDKEQEQAIEETGTYVGFNPNMPKGSRHQVRFMGGVIYGEMITPVTVSSGKQVAVYRSDTDQSNLFDTL